MTADHLAGMVGMVTTQWEELLRLRRVVLAEPSAADIHDLRVASRRLRAALETLAPVLGKDRTRRLRQPIRQLTRELGQLRNLDEARSYLLGLDEAGLTPLTAALEQQQHTELGRIQRMLKKLPCKRLDHRVRRAIQRLLIAEQRDTGTTVGLLSNRSLSLYRPIHDLLQRPDLAQRPDERHALRIAIKKWRYFNEQLAYLCGRRHDRLVEMLKRYQTLLGDLNDREVFAAMVCQTSTITADTRQAVLAVIESQRRRLLTQFRRLLARQPLQYQFSWHERKP